MITIKELREIIRESPFIGIYGLNENQIDEVVEETIGIYDKVGGVYLGQWKI